MRGMISLVACARSSPVPTDSWGPGSAGALREGGHEVRALVRPGGDPGALVGLGVEEVRGDVTDPASLPAAVRGCDLVFHLAGIRRAPRREDFLRVNAEGTRLLLEACAAHAPGLSRFVLCGSLASVGPSATPRREEEPFAPREWYGESKAEAERLTLSFAGRMPVTIARPPRITGPGDRENLLFFRIAARGILLGLRAASSGRSPGWTWRTARAGWCSWPATPGRWGRPSSWPRRSRPASRGCSGRWPGRSASGPGPCASRRRLLRGVGLARRRGEPAARPAPPAQPQAGRAGAGAGLGVRPGQGPAGARVRGQGRAGGVDRPVGGVVPEGRVAARSLTRGRRGPRVYMVPPDTSRSLRTAWTSQRSPQPGQTTKVISFTTSTSSCDGGRGDHRAAVGALERVHRPGARQHERPPPPGWAAAALDAVEEARLPDRGRRVEVGPAVLARRRSRAGGYPFPSGVSR